MPRFTAGALGQLGTSLRVRFVATTSISGPGWRWWR
jgi:hypothetical protein